MLLKLNRLNLQGLNSFYSRKTYASMKKQLLLFVLFLGLMSTGAQAQGKMFLGLDLGFNSNDAGYNGNHEVSQFNLGPSLGYWLNDNSAIVVGINFSSHDNKTDDIKDTGFGIGAEFRYGWHFGDNVYVYLAPGIGFNSYKTDDSGTETKWTQLDIGISPGVSYMLADKWSINAYFGGLGYSSQKPDGGDAVNAFGLSLDMSSLGFGLWYHF